MSTKNLNTNETIFVGGKVPDICRYIDDLRERYERDELVPERVGIWSIRSANDVIAEARKKPVPRQLYSHFWYEGEVGCLFADSNLGKSLLAVDIADGIALQGLRVLYFDFELSDKQFQLRYTADDGGFHRFANSFYRVSISRDGIVGEQNSGEIMDQIERAIEATKAQVVIVDNLTWMCTSSENGEEAATLMRRLMQLKFKYELSMLVVAHTPKRDMQRPITANDLAGSKKLFNFFDSAFAIGRSARDESLRYLKQIKCRNGEFVYDGTNVVVCSIERGNDGKTSFVSHGTTSESEHLRSLNEREVSALSRSIVELHEQGESIRSIADRLGISRSKVDREIRKYHSVA